MDSPFTIVVYTSALKRRGWVGAYESCQITMRHMAKSQATLVLRADHRMAGPLMDLGARFTVAYQDQQIFSGAVTAPQQDGLAGQDTITFGAEGDWRILEELTLPFDTARTDDLTIFGGTREQILAEALSADQALHGITYPVPVTVEIATNRTDVKLPAQPWRTGVPLTDELIPALARISASTTKYPDNPGWGIRVGQNGLAGIRVETYQGIARKRVLDSASGVVRDLSWTRNLPTATRVYAKAVRSSPTETTVYSYTDTALEKALGRVIPLWVDVQLDDSHGRPSDSVTQAAADAQGKAALAAAGPSASYSLTLAETDSFKFGKTFQVGDLVTVSVAAGLTTTEVVNEVTLSHTRDAGLVIESRIGAENRPLHRQAKILAAVVARTRWIKK